MLNSYLFWHAWHFWNCANIGLVSTVKIIFFVTVNARKRWQKKQDNHLSTGWGCFLGGEEQGVVIQIRQQAIMLGKTSWKDDLVSSAPSTWSQPPNVELPINSHFLSSKRVRHPWAVNHSSRKTLSSFTQRASMVLQPSRQKDAVRPALLEASGP